MDLHQKLARLAEKQHAIEVQIADQASAANAAVAQALATLIQHQPQAATALRHDKILSTLSKRDAQRLTSWLDRLVPAQAPAQTPSVPAETSAVAPETLPVDA